MVDVFFFADPKKMESQKDEPVGFVGHDKAFGPVLGSEDTRFRVTSLHRGADGADPAAYAVCKGRVRLQPDGTDETFTLVLAPDVKLLRGVPIRYFVYRGIRLTDDTGAVVLNDLTRKILKKENTDGTDDKQEMKVDLDALGLAFRPADESPLQGFAREDDDPIDSIFYETTSLKAVPVKAGDELGTFAGEGFGFEILLGTVWEPPTLALLRNFSPSTGKLIEVPEDSAPHLGARQRAVRERVYAYLDPCAFYGMCSPKASPVRVHYKASLDSSDSTSDEDATKVEVEPLKNPDEVYRGLLFRFRNRHRVYIDLRNENGLSYNYYDLYGKANDAEVLVEVTGKLSWKARKNAPLNPADDGHRQTYATQGWPLKIIDPPPKHDSSEDDSSKKDRVSLRLALATGEEPSDHYDRRVFFEYAFPYYRLRDSAPTRRRGPRKRFRWPGQAYEQDVKPAKLDPENGEPATPSSWTKDVAFALPSVEEDESHRPIAFCLRLRYLRQTEGARNDGADRYINTGSVWDNRFALQVSPARWQNDNPSSWWLTGHLKHVKPGTDNQMVYEGIAETGVAIDRDPVSTNDSRITFFFVPVRVARKPPNYRVTAGSNFSGTGGRPGMKSSFFQLVESGGLDNGSSKLKLVKASEFKGTKAPDKAASSYLTFLTFVELKNSKERTSLEQDNHSRESLCSLSLSSAEYQRVIDLVTENGFDRALHPPFLQVRARVYPRSHTTGPESAYQALELRVAGFDQSGRALLADIPSSGPDGIRPLSLFTDGLTFCTHDAASFEPLDVLWCYNPILQLGRHPAINDEEHAHDQKYLQRALAQLKTHHPSFYSRLERLQLLGTEVIFHDNPDVPQRRTFPIEILFDPEPMDLAGVTEAAPGEDDEGYARGYYKGILPRGRTITSNQNFTITRLRTLASLSDQEALKDFDKYGELNARRYAKLNGNRDLSPSEVNKRFMKEYTDAEIQSTDFLEDRLYVESDWKSADVDVYERTTLAALRKMGAGTLHPENPVLIRINRTEMLLYYEGHYDGGNGEIVEFDKQLEFVTTTLAHELGHAEFMITESLVDCLWSQLEQVFDCPVRNMRDAKIVRKKDPTIKNELSNLEIVPEYPNPPLLSRWWVAKSSFKNRDGLFKRLKTIEESLTDDQVIKDLVKEFGASVEAVLNELSERDKLMRGDGFLAKTGPGHLRGSPTAQHAALPDVVVSYGLKAAHNKARLEATSEENKAKLKPLEVNVDYIFPNLDPDFMEEFDDNPSSFS